MGSGGENHWTCSERFWTCREGMQKILDALQRGRRKFFRLGNFVFNVPIKSTIFSCFVGFLGTLNFLVKGGGRKISDTSQRGGLKISDAS